MAIGYDSVFIDTAPFIYILENEDSAPRYYHAVRQFLSDCVVHGAQLITSVVTVEEYMVHPYISGEAEYVRKFDRFIDMFHICVVPIDKSIAHCAAKIRAEHRSFKAMDALQLGAAIECGCGVFLTNDKRLVPVTGVQCVIVDYL